MLGGVTVVPVVVAVGIQTHSARNIPVHRKIYRVVPGRVGVARAQCVPGLCHSGSAAQVDFHQIAAEGEPEPFHEDECLGGVHREGIACSQIRDICVEEVVIEVIFVSVDVIFVHFQRPGFCVVGGVAVAETGHSEDGEFAFAQGTVHHKAQIGVIAGGGIGGHRELHASVFVPQCVADGVLHYASVQEGVDGCEGLFVGVPVHTP